MPPDPMSQVVIPEFQPVQTDNQPTESQQELEPEYSDFAKGILSGIPETDRATVGKYIKDWDGNVTKKFQEIHQQYEPYKQLGDIEDVQTAMYYRSMMQNDPVEFVKQVTDAMREAGMSLDDLNFNGEEEAEPEAPVGSVPKEYVQRMDRLETMLGTMFEKFDGYTSSQESERQIQMLDNKLSQMHSAHGDFDDEWVLLQIEKGKDPDEAVDMYIKKFGSPSRKPAPTLLSANGAVRQDQVVPSKLTPEQRRQYAAQIMAANMD